MLLDKLQFDVFKWFFEKHKPHFSTLFFNSTAHMQHAYWRHMDPDAFKLKPDEEERAEYGGAVLFGYQEMDKLVGKILDLAGSDVSIVFTSALGQQPYTKLEDEGGKHFYRPRKFADVTAFAGIASPHTCSPVMSEEFHVYFEDEAAADAGMQVLKGMTVDGRQALALKREDPKTILAGCGIYSTIPPEATLTSAAGETKPFFDLFYSADTVKSGMHHPDGVFWVRTPSRDHAVHTERVSLRAVAPTVTRLLGLEPPEFMREEALVAEAEAVS